MQNTNYKIELTDKKSKILEEIVISVNGFISEYNNYPSVIILNKPAKRKFEKELTLESAELQDSYKNGAVNIYNNRTVIAYIDNKSPKPLFELH